MATTEKNDTASEIQKRKAAQLEEMKPETREIAKEFHGKLGECARGIVMVKYDIGRRIAAIVQDEDTYGTNAVEELASYLSIPGGAATLYDCKGVATAFDRKFVQELSAKPMRDGTFLAIQHWINLTQLSSAKDREKMLKWTIANSASAADLAREIAAGQGGKVKAHARAGGRKPAQPTSPVAGLLKVGSIGKQFTNFAEAVEDSVFEAIDKMPVDRMNEALLEKLQSTRETVEGTKERTEKVLEQIDKNIERVTAAIAHRAETPAEETDEEDADDSAKPKSSGGPPKASKGKKKAKRKKTAAA